MTGMTIAVKGGDQLATGARRVAQQVDRVIAAAGPRAGSIVLAAVRPPILTGRLASTVHVIATEQGFGIAAGGERAPYVAIVNARHPFIAPAFVTRETEVVDTYAAALEQLVSTI